MIVLNTMSIMYSSNNLNLVANRAVYLKIWLTFSIHYIP